MHTQMKSLVNMDSYTVCICLLVLKQRWFRYFKEMLILKMLFVLSYSAKSLVSEPSLIYFIAGHPVYICLSSSSFQRAYKKYTMMRLNSSTMKLHSHLCTNKQQCNDNNRWNKVTSQGRNLPAYQIHYIQITIQRQATRRAMPIMLATYGINSIIIT